MWLQGKKEGIYSFLKESYLHNNNFYKNLIVERPKHNYLLLLMHLLEYNIPFRGFCGMDNNINYLNNALHVYFENDCSDTRELLTNSFLKLKKIISKRKKYSIWKAVKNIYKNGLRFNISFCISR